MSAARRCTAAPGSSGEAFPGGSGCQPGTVYLVGAGPGDPGLLTCRALRLLQTAEVVIHDALVTGAVRSLAPATAEHLNVGKRSGHHLARQGGIAALMIEQARAGRRVVRLKGGDPGVFGRVGEEMEALRRAGIPYELVPGISSALAASGLSGISLTHRRLSGAVTVITGHDAASPARDALPLEALVALNHTIVVLMGLGRLPVIVQRLVDAGMAPTTPVAVIQAASTAGQRTVRATLATIVERAAAAGVASPATVVIGAVAALHDVLAWRPEGAGPAPFPPGAAVGVARHGATEHGPTEHGVTEHGPTEHGATRPGAST